ncbi:MAG: MFS transporter [Terriglobia bacterium]|jgi:ACS family glucarate transporter-like MFS transporter
MECPVDLKRSPDRWWLMVLLMASMTFCYAQRGAMSVAAPLAMRELGLSPATAGILLSSFFWVYAFMQLPAGWLVDRIGPKWSYVFGYLLGSTAFGLTGLFNTLIPLVALRVFLGAGQAVIFPASARAVADCFEDKERGTVTAAYLMGVRVGQALVGYLAAHFLKAYGWRSFFVVGGAVSLLWLFPWLGFWRKSERREVAAARAPTGTAQKSLSFKGSIALLKQKSVLGIFLGFFAYDYAWFVYVAWLPGYLVMERHFSVEEMGIYSSAPYVAMLVVILLSGFLSDRLVGRGLSETRVRKAFIISGLAIGCLIIPAGLVEDKLTAVWLLTISLCGLGVATPNTWTLTQAVCAKKIVGTVSGIQNFGGNVGGIIAPLLTGYIAHTTGSFALALIITGAILAGGILAYGFLIQNSLPGSLTGGGTDVIS